MHSNRISPGAGNGLPLTSSLSSSSSNLDLIRAVAVLCVFFAHLHVVVSGGVQSTLGWHFAQMGVLTFFVHTSMVLMLSLERTPAKGKALFGPFYLRRVFRLYPLSMFCVTLAMVLGANPELGNTSRNWTFAQYLSNMALTTNLTYSDNMVGGLWTLPLEVQMYLALPILFLLGRARPLATLLLLWVASVPLAILQPHVSVRLNVVGYVPCFVAGVIAWKISLSAARRIPGWVWPFGFAATWSVFFLATHDNDMYFRWAFCITLGLAIPWFQEIRFQPLRTVAHYVAKYSYGIYLSHMAVMFWTFGLPLSMPLRWLVFVPAAAIVPVLMFHLIENPMIKAGNKFSNRIFFPSRADSMLGRERLPAEIPVE